jgi:hypothetical protein
MDWVGTGLPGVVTTDNGMNMAIRFPCALLPIQGCETNSRMAAWVLEETHHKGTVLHVVRAAIHREEGMDAVDLMAAVEEVSNQMVEAAPQCGAVPE